MQEWSSHFYNDVAGTFLDDIQMLRPDYSKAMSALRRKANIILHNKPKEIAVLDVACGSAMATRQVFDNSDILVGRQIRFVGLDDDPALLKDACQRWPRLVSHRDDMVRAKIEEKFDLVLCSFAYHHVPDSDKPYLCKNLRKWCKPDGDLLVLEICLTENQVQEYYAEVMKKLRAGPMFEYARKFIMWTMEPNPRTNGEWKVPTARLLKDFKQAGWEICERKAIWTAPSLPTETGCQFLHFRPKRKGVHGIL